MKVYIGCSGFNYRDWKEKFYPEDLPQKKWLEYYAGHFNTVEINNTFYSFPREENLKQWVEGTPGNFKFTIKANRYFTHMKKLKADDQFHDRMKEFQRIINTAGSKVECVLWQLPGNLHKNISKIRSVSGILDHSLHHVIEFRHESWFDQEIYDVLREEGLTFCILSAPGDFPEDAVTTSDAAYVRFHGKTKWYDYQYSDDELDEWKKRLDKLKGVEKLFIYFNNDVNANAVNNALKLASLYESP